MATPDVGAFAETRPPDDLFIDDFTPLAEPVVEPAPSLEPVLRPGGQSQSSTHPLPNQQNHGANGPRKQPTGRNTSKQGTDGANSRPGTLEANKQTTSARGDRTATGGTSKPRLTTEELNAKMEAMKVKNSNLEEAHARQKADEESFRANEAATKERNRQERANRQAMLSEREKNAQRKMQAQQGRDWDVSKEESDVVDKPHTRPMRGAHGGIARELFSPADGLDSRSGRDSQTRGTPDNRGNQRGGRGRGRGGMRRGDFQGEPHSSRNNRPSQTVPNAQDFPALSGGAEPHQNDPPKIDTAVSATRPEPARVDSLGVAVTPAGEQRSWADQMDDSPANWQTGAGEQRAPKSGW